MKRVLLLVSFLILAHVIFAQNLFPTTGNADVGTSTPNYPLTVLGTIYTTKGLFAQITTPGAYGMFLQGAATGTNGDLIMEGNGSGVEFWLTASNSYLQLGGNGGTEPSQGAINNDGSGHVGVNTKNTSGFNFNVNGITFFDQVTVEAFSSNNPNASPWADYVFDKDYQLPSIYSVADYIKTNNHLPGIPTTAEVRKNGLDLGATQAKLLEKIEQLTLYTIQLQQQVDSVKAQSVKLADLQQQIDELKKRSR